MRNDLLGRGKTTLFDRDNFFQKYGFYNNTSVCIGQLGPEEICNDSDRVAEFYDCYFKQHQQIFKCAKDAFKIFQHAVMRKR
ncbi:hypothetical protein MRX96_046771 [Rhipicephalus microplus]